MKVAITVTENSLDANIDPRFGRCAYMILVDSESGEVLEGGENEFANAAGGAGTQTAQRVANWGAEAVLTGNVGPKAHGVLKAAGINVYTGLSGTAHDALEAFKAGKLDRTDNPTVDAHFGM